MKSPRHTSPRSSLNVCHLSSVPPFPHPDIPLRYSSDTFDESQQCSADPNAFLGFRVSPTGRDMHVNVLQESQQKKQTLKLVLDLEMTREDVDGSSNGPGDACDSRSINPFQDLLYGSNTQDNEEIGITSLVENEKQMERKKDEISMEMRAQNTEKTTTCPSPCSRMEKQRRSSKWRTWKQKQMSGNEEDTCHLEQGGDKKRVCDNENLRPLLADNNEKVVLRSSQTACMSVVSSLNDEIIDEEKEIRNQVTVLDKEKLDRSVVVEDSNREKESRDVMECAREIVEQDIHSMDETRNYEDCDDEETEEYPFCESENLPYEAQRVVASASYSPRSLVVIPTLDRPNDERDGKNKVTSREGLQAVQQECLMLGIDSSQVGQSDSAEMNGECVNSMNRKSNVKQNLTTLEHDADQDECAPTQPSMLEAESEPLVEPAICSEQNAEKSDELLAKQHVTGTDIHGKAIQSLEYSISIPELQQEVEPGFSANLSGDGTPATKRLEVSTESNKPSPFSSSITPVCLATSTQESSIDGQATLEVAIDNHMSPKKKATSVLQSALTSDKKKRKAVSQVIHASCQTISTPIAKDRNSAVFLDVSPPNDALAKKCNDSGFQTPRYNVRRSSRSTQTPSSTPTARTRARMLTPVPLQRTYASRSRTLFKYKYEFCLTGFVKTSVKHLKELIEGHGGKVPERYEDVLNKTNPKAVVIATPVAWRKRKFMQAIACGIPVVHTDWIKNCIDAGHVIPFDGFQVPTGYSVTTRKFECAPPKELQIFEGYSFGIASDVSQMSRSEAEDKANLMVFILKACGAKAVYENLSAEESINVDVVLCDEYTPTCRYYKKRRHIPVKDFQWVTECIVLQQFLDLEEPDFEPLRVGSDDVFAASAEIGDSDSTTLKLYKGELVMADIGGSAADHYLLFDVCEILSIHVSGCKDEDSPTKQKDCKESRVRLRVGMLKREPYNPELSKIFVKVLDISSYQVKRRVVAISKKHYSQLKYKDESIFYLKDEPHMSTKSEHKRPTQ